ncbi:MAG: hypothetical protein A3H63_00700 [Candidatus Harrisonbacteria bacterium RIFCSPLOWO2_02_FULL_45_10c]|uniref:Uncharacterized protein n=1 Tax=Candidatus Harrisonbacteria bacterium RIFCSPLOWO2_02_FULL_45_10c TaxID=1798410 RepID=A0A1G1ZT84_9BACT|nr:MAG: hypothetical protein A3H63_00700 [Candidatus Harrisonbacteria bacterium RIFCSPLOWO2_02_FULL_45_10c]
MNIMETAFSNSPAEAVGVDTSRNKVIAIGVLGTVLAGAFGYFLSIFFKGVTLPAGISLAVAAIGFLIMVLLQTFFIKGESVSLLLLLIESTAAVAPLYAHFSFLFLVAWVLLFLGLWFATKRGRRELDNQLKIHFFRIEHLVIPRTLTAISIFISLLYVGLLDFNGAAIPKSSFTAMLDSSTPVVRQFVNSGFSFDMPVSKLADIIVAQQLAKQLGPAVVIPQSTRNEAVRAVLDQLHVLGADYGIIFRNSDSVADVLYGYINNSLAKIPEAFQSLVPVGFALVVFLTVKGVAVLLRWAIALPAYGLYEAAFLFGFSKLALESRTREIVLLK